MRKAILQNDVIDVIYDTICGYPLNEAYEILENHRAGKYIPVEWLKNKSKDLADAYWNNVRNKLVLNMNELPLVIDEIVRIWGKENDKNI